MQGPQTSARDDFEKCKNVQWINATFGVYIIHNWNVF